MSSGFESVLLLTIPPFCLAICTTAHRPGRHHELVTAAYVGYGTLRVLVTRAVTACEAQEKIDALADLWDMLLRFEYELSSAG
jgi:hypothetical protein